MAFRSRATVQETVVLSLVIKVEVLLLKHLLEVIPPTQHTVGVFLLILALILNRYRWPTPLMPLHTYSGFAESPQSTTPILRPLLNVLRVSITKQAPLGLGVPGASFVIVVLSVVTVVRTLLLSLFEAKTPLVAVIVPPHLARLVHRTILALRLGVKVIVVLQVWSSGERPPEDIAIRVMFLPPLKANEKTYMVVGNLIDTILGVIKVVSILVTGPLLML